MRLLLAAGLITALAPAATAQAHTQSHPHGHPTDRSSVRCASTSPSLLSAAVGHRAAVDSALPATTGGTAYCDVRAHITVRGARHSVSVIHLRLQVPEDWNRRYVQLGGGGFCGSIPTEGQGGDAPLKAGYAVASDDTGHQGNALDASFGFHNDAAQRTWGYLSEHLTAQASQQILRRLAGTRPTHSYFVGCSTGGRQALMLAQRFPADFDGIVAGAPANRQNYLAPLSQGVRELQNRDADHHVILDAAAAIVVQRGVLAACDGTGVGGDTVKDGIVQDPRQCTFDPATLQCPDGVTTGCLSAEQVRVVKEWYDSPRDAQGREFYPGGLPVGSEGSWVGYDIGTDAAFAGGGAFAEQSLRYLAFPRDPGPDYSLYDFDPNRDAPRLRAMAREYNSDSPNLDAFHARGGKLILYHGLADPLISPFGTIQYYEDVVHRYGSLTATERWARLFLLPGVYHCVGGPGPDTVDWLSTIRGWTEHGTAPDQVVASKVVGGVTTMQRPVYAYPMQAQHIEGKDPNSVSGWTPVLGPRGRQLAVTL
ncbi:MAG: tannase/feruloyl esterase family alpha/beta hydrolase [Motilibacteraceae bacterium]